MKLLRNERGYALLVVLLLVVLMLGVSATFMAGSMNHAKQEQTVDASNQAVASAEMGVVYYSADFQREIGIIKSEIIEMTQERIKSLVDCFNSNATSCNDQAKLTALEKKIDEDMRAEYISKIVKKVTDLSKLKEFQSTPFPGQDTHYAITGTSVSKQNAEKQDVSLATTSDKFVTSLKIQIDLSGESAGNIRYLKGTFVVEVPETFLSTEESLTIETKTFEDSDLSYDDIFFDSWPTIDCDELLTRLSSETESVEYSCILGTNHSANDFVESLLEKNLDPKDFKIFTNNFKGNICETSCNALKLEGITVVARSDDGGLFNNGGNNLNSMSNINLLIDGHFNPQNMNSLGDEGTKQTIILRELTIRNNLMGSGLLNTNLMILGKKPVEGVILQDSRMDFQGNLRISDNGRICFDLDRIIPDHIKNLSEKATFTPNNTTGQIIYYTSDLSAKRFYLSNNNGSEDVERTKLYVTGYDKYTDFLSSCGIDVTETTTEITDVPYPYILDPGFDLNVEY